MDFPLPHIKPASSFLSEDRAAIHSALVEARPLLWDGKDREALEQGKQEYICYALSEVGGPGAELASDVIGERLFPKCFFSTWTTSRIGEHPGYVRMQELRARWMNALIAEFAQ